MNRVAIIDIGSNSLKLIISDIYDNKFFQISYEKKTKLRLSNYKTRANDITALGIKKLTSSLEEMKNAINYIFNIEEDEKELLLWQQKHLENPVMGKLL